MSVGLLDRIEKDYIEAYKARNEIRVAVLRLLKTATKNRRVELCRDLTDPEIVEVVLRQAKQRRESIEQYTAAGRPDLADREARELDELAAYLPKTLSDEELAAAIERAVAAQNATGPKDMGRVMQALTQAHKGQFDGRRASELVKARLQAQRS